MSRPSMSSLLLAVLLAAACLSAQAVRPHGVLATVASFLKGDAVSGDAPWFCHDLDCPDFSVEQRLAEGGIELRSYSSGVWVSTNVSGMHYDKAVGVGFMRLFEYISGANLELQRINMTAPVRVRVVPGAGPFCEDHFVISFYVPPALQAAPPAPASSKVYLDPASSSRFFVWSYPGFTSESRVLEQAQDTVDKLGDAGLVDGEDFDASYFFAAGYDSPFRLLNRHNEIWIPAL